MQCLKRQSIALSDVRASDLGLSFLERLGLLSASFLRLYRWFSVFVFLAWLATRFGIHRFCFWNHRKVASPRDWASPLSLVTVAQHLRYSLQEQILVNLSRGTYGALSTILCRLPWWDITDTGDCRKAIPLAWKTFFKSLWVSIVFLSLLSFFILSILRDKNESNTLECEMQCLLLFSFRPWIILRCWSLANFVFARYSFNLFSRF